MYKSTFSLHDSRGRRKYLNQSERLRFLECTQNRPIEIKLFSQLLYYTGARIAEIHNLTSRNIDFSNRTVVIKTLKQQKKGVYREIPLPDFLLEELAFYIEAIPQKEKNSQLLWSFSLRSASRYIKSIMCDAEIYEGSAKSLRHGFAVHCINFVPISNVQKWLGHSSSDTTSIYLDVTGTEEREIAEKIWC